MLCSHLQLRATHLLQSGKRQFSKATFAGPSIPNMQHLKRFYKRASVVPHPESDSFPKLSPTEDVTFENCSLSHGKYWAVALDGRILKTMYKDSMPIPSRALAVALAEEWESQKEKIDLKSLHLN